MSTPDGTHALRQAMVAELRELGGIRTDRVAAAFAAVPRHLFAPQEPVELAYAANSSVWPRHDASGRLTSTVSAAHIQAVQLERADVQPGMQVLEIGSSGYNAALLAELVGPDGEVTSVDIDPVIVERARGCLDAAGYARVRTVLADGDEGATAHGPYDRVVVTARSWDVPPAWVEQLLSDGRIVLPLRLRCLTSTVALDRVSGAGLRLTGGDVRLWSFVPMPPRPIWTPPSRAPARRYATRSRTWTAAAPGPSNTARPSPAGSTSGWRLQGTPHTPCSSTSPKAPAKPSRTPTASPLTSTIMPATGTPRCADTPNSVSRAQATIQHRVQAWGELLHADGLLRDVRNALLQDRNPTDYRYLDWLYGPTPDVVLRELAALGVSA